MIPPRASARGPAPKNLVVPDYLFKSDTTVQIG